MRCPKFIQFFKQLEFNAQCHHLLHNLKLVSIYLPCGAWQINVCWPKPPIRLALCLLREMYCACGSRRRHSRAERCADSLFQSLVHRCAAPAARVFGQFIAILRQNPTARAHASQARRGPSWCGRWRRGSVRQHNRRSPCAQGRRGGSAATSMGSATSMKSDSFDSIRA